MPFPIVIALRLAIGISRPRQPIIGIVMSGEIEAVGKDIKRFKKGDQVYGLTGFGLSTYAQYKCMKETDSPKNGCLAVKPANVSHEEATAAAYGGLLAFQYMEKGNIKPKQNVAIYGASGTTGTMAVQFAKYLGANVTGICSTRNLEFVASLGADTVIDYTKETTIDPDTTYDFVLDAVGKFKTSAIKKAIKNSLSSTGIYESIDNGDLLLDSKRLEYITKLVEEKHIKPVLDKTYPLEHIVEAHHYVGKGHKRGGVAIFIAK